jgi:hypothetical protein
MERGDETDKEQTKKKEPKGEEGERTKTEVMKDGRKQGKEI